jgi:hypothetical protein
MEEFKRKPKSNRFSNLENNASNWIDNDEEWADLIDSKQKNKNAFDKGKDDEKVEVNIKLSLPKANLDKLKSLKLKKLNKKSVKSLKKYSKKQYIIAGAICCLIIIGVGFTILTNGKKSSKAVAGASKTASTKADSDIPEEKPKYPILYPGNKTEKTVGKIVRISPPNQPPAYTYIDNLGGIKIKVTQQEIPERFKTDPDGELSKLATAYNQKDIIQVDSVKVYVGKSTSGVQSLIFIKGNLLISITSENKVSDESWVAYISSLHS